MTSGIFGIGIGISSSGIDRRYSQTVKMSDFLEVALLTLSTPKMSIPFVYTGPQKQGKTRSNLAKRHFTKTRMNTGVEHIWRRLEKPEKVSQTLCH
jgi:hypothetical protein